MLGLEYLLLFGVPGNKWELIDGRIRWAFPFLDRNRVPVAFRLGLNASLGVQLAPARLV